MFKYDTCVPQVKDNPVHWRHRDLNVLCAWKRISALFIKLHISLNDDSLD